MQVRLKLWVEEGGRVLFGEGRQLLLEAVERHGSLAGAARELNMSYRAAWGRLKASEERLGFPLVEKSVKDKRSMQLTGQARDLMKAYAQLMDLAQEHLSPMEDTLTEVLTRHRK